MDEWFELIVNALKSKKAYPDERCTALIRAGLIAQAYSGSKEDVLATVFGSGPLLQDGNNNQASAARGASGGASQ
jgi:hypothetical protein